MKILEMSFIGIALIVVIVIIRALAINKLPKWTFLVLWEIVLCRLLLPFSFQSPFSPVSTVSTLPLVSIDTHELPTIISDAASWMTTSGPIQENKMIDSPALLSPSPLVWIWLAGTLSMIAFFLITHLRSLNQYKTSLPIDNSYANQWIAEHPTRRPIQIRQSDQIISPLTYGIWRPVILLPKTTDYTNISRLHYILTHELIHIKRFDTFKKWLLATALAIHWFNPFVWVMYILANRDIELSCDESVLRTVGETKKSSYALTLIGMEETKGRLTPLFNSFSKNAIEERITAIMTIRKITVHSILISLIIVAGLSVVTAASAITYNTSVTENKTSGLLEKALGNEINSFKGSIKQANEPTATLVTDDYTIYIESTLVTANRVYALIGAKGILPNYIDWRRAISGRILYNGNPFEESYSLGINNQEIELSKDGTRYFLFSAPVDESERISGIYPKQLEITMKLDREIEHVLKTLMLGNDTSTSRIIYPNPALYEGDYFETIILMSTGLRMSGQSKQEYENTEQQLNEQLRTQLTIILDDGNRISFTHDSRGTIYDEYYPLSINLGIADTLGDEFYHYWDFKGWELDLNKVTALIVDGKTYKMNK